jgi:hypothetical protein
MSPLSSHAESDWLHPPVSEYLRFIYEPDCDYVDGELQERNLSEQDIGVSAVWVVDPPGMQREGF